PMHTASAPQPVSLINGYGTDETVAPRQPLAAAAAPESATGAAGPEGVGIAALATPTPEAQGMLGAGPMPEPSPQPSEWGRGAGPAVVEQPTLTAEEATRMALAPPGKGGGVETDAPEPAGTPDGAGPVAALEATGVPEEPAAAAARAAVPQPAGSQPETAEDRVAAGTLEAPPAGRDRWRAARFELARYPWRPLAVAMAAVLAALLAATLWLRHRRAHWP
ncbi:MAG TPA: hypothetical protein PLB78_10435, partial [Anaerolineae bacterium]|nr:hypothetical protein [Anaerolineae bacterium]